MAGKIVVLSTLDTKGFETKFLKEQIEIRGLETTIIDFGVIGQPVFKPDITREEVAEASDTVMTELISKNDRGLAMNILSKGVVKIVNTLYLAGKLDGIISLGGSMGTTVGTAAMRCLPIGIPKIMISTMASGDVRAFVGTRDITMMYPVVDILGLNSVSRKILANAAGAISGMVQQTVAIQNKERSLVSITMVGITTPCIMKAKSLIEERGYDTIVFHATGSGGQAMEELIDEGLIKGVLDVSIPEVAGELVGALTAGPNRMEAAGRKGIPQVICPGAADGVVFMGMDKVPEKFRNRKLLGVAPNITVMRTNEDENAILGKIVAQKANKALGPIKILIPLKGFSAFDAKGEWGYDPEADRAFISALRENIDDEKIEVIDMDVHINDEEFARKLVDIFIQL